MRTAALLCTLLVAAFAFGGEGARVEILRRVKGPRHTIITTQFDYASGKTWRIVTDANDGKVLREELLPGRAQSTRREVERAISIIAKDPALQVLLSRGAQTEGGFIIDGPSGQPADHRYIQIRVLSADRRTLLRVVVVDLSAGIVALVRERFE